MRDNLVSEAGDREDQMSGWCMIVHMGGGWKAASGVMSRVLARSEER